MIHPLARLALEWGNQQVWIAQTAQESIRQKIELKEGVRTPVNPNFVIYDIILFHYDMEAEISNRYNVFAYFLQP